MIRSAPRAVRLLVAISVLSLCGAVVAADVPHGGGYLNPPGMPPRGRTPPSGSGESKRLDPAYPASPTGNPSPGGPGSPGAPSPGAPAPVPGPAGGGGPRTGGGIVLERDPTQWQDWWELNRDPYLRVREALRAPGAVTSSDEFFMGAGRVRAVDTLAPSDAMVRGDVAPRLRRLLAEKPHRDVVTACLIALAKVGQDRADFPLVPILAEHLRDADQEVRETAALALGLSGAVDARPMLVALLLDAGDGRRAVGRERVEDRVRAFAAYGLALSARNGGDPAVRRAAFDSLREVLAAARDDRDLRAAAILGIGLLAPEAASADRRLRMEAIELLRREWEEDVGPGRDVVRCHAATSIARLLEGSGDAALTVFHVRRFAATVTDAEAGDDLRRAAALALGSLSRGVDDETRGAAREGLIAAFRGAKDHQTRYFALIGLGRLGDDDARTFLLGVLTGGQRAIERPWAALALGLRQHDRRRAGESDPVLVEAIGAQLADVKSPGARAAFAVALGLCGDAVVADDLRDLLADVEAQDELAGHICVALALLRDARAIPVLRELVATSSRRPQRLREAAVALGALGDRSAAELLVQGLRDGRPTLAQVASISVGLGLIGDRRSIEPLLALAQDEAMPDLSRAFAIVAVGKIVERGDLPWNAPLAAGLNYRAALETLIDGVRGVLDVH